MRLPKLFKKIKQSPNRIHGEMLKLFEECGTDIYKNMLNQKYDKELADLKVYFNSKKLCAKKCKIFYSTVC